MQLKPEIKPDRAYAEIRIDAILRNFDALCALLPRGVKKMAVVKANAYGHGAVPVSKALEDKADYFAVSCIAEALELRKAGIAKPILNLGYSAPFLYQSLVENEIAVTLYSPEDARELARTALALKKKARVHIAVDTGMGRIGVPADENGVQTALEIAATEGLDPEGVFSHFACADAKDDGDAVKQSARFDRFLSALADRGFSPRIKHICNSAGSIRMENKYDLCRFGISLYGYAPDPAMPCRVKLIPAMTVKSRVIHVKEVEKGVPIGYGHDYVAPDKRRIATVGIGYGDGYNRCISGKGYVLLGGKRASIVGRICMDQMMIDVTEIPETKVGDEVVVLGRSGEEEISADLLGSWANSFSYEVLSTFLPRVERFYV